MPPTPFDQPVAFVEIPKGSRNKYEYDATLRRVTLNRTLFASVVYPCDYGFLLDTLGADGDPLDALVLVTEPTFPGCLIACDLVGMLEMRDDEGDDAKLLCVPHHDPTWSRIHSYKELRHELLDEIAHFFEVYKDLEPDKHVQVGDWCARNQAVEAYNAGREAWLKTQHGSPTDA